MARYRLALVSPGKEGSVVSGSWKYLVSFYRLTLPLLAAYVDPNKYDVHIIEESVDRIVPDDNFDLVAMSVMTPYAPRAYELAREYRARGAKVVLGGVHPSLLPEEAAQHADAIVIGEAETTWPRVLDDFEGGVLEQRYESVRRNDDIRLLPDRDALKGKSLMTFGTVETSRGCPKSCSHCAIIASRYGAKYEPFDVDSVLRDIVRIRGKNIFFVDDNFFGTNRLHRGRILQLMNHMEPLRKRWFCQATIEVADDTELLEAAAKAGCAGMYIGFESVFPDSLREIRKNWSRSGRFVEQARRIRDFGIAIEAGFIFGFDNDTPDVFDQTAEFVYRSGVESPNAHILTPYPGTALYKRLGEEGRILTHDWSQYNTGNVVFRPAGMTPDELREGYARWYREVFSPLRTLRRISQSNYKHYSLLMNAAKFVSVHRKF
jgi:radical SAM superfamily enzyme YgiQ (UPF0313 family)